MRPLAPVLLASLLSLPATAHAASDFGHFKYTIPPGWREARYANGVLLSPKDAPEGQHLDLTLMPSRDWSEKSGMLSQTSRLGNLYWWNHL